MIPDIEKMNNLLRHILAVHQNCVILAQKLMEQGKFELGLLLVQQSLKHDNSKFSGIEWDNLQPDNPDPVSLKLAIKHHGKTNDHHPEKWGGIKNMPDLALAELVADWKTRASEFGTDLRDWIHNDAMKRFSFNTDDEVYTKIMYYVDLLLDKPFKAIQ